MNKLTEGQPDFVSSTDFLQFVKQEEKAGVPLSLLARTLYNSVCFLPSRLHPMG